jgi:hypothetical protein
VLKTESERPFFAVSRKVLSENGHFSGVLSFDKPPKNGIVRFQSRFTRECRLISALIRLKTARHNPQSDQPGGVP